MKTNRIPIYHIGLLKQGKKLILQTSRTVDGLSCEISEYLGSRQVTKAKLKHNAKVLLAEFRKEKKFENCEKLIVE